MNGMLIAKESNGSASFVANGPFHTTCSWADCVTQGCCSQGSARALRSRSGRLRELNSHSLPALIHLALFLLADTFNYARLSTFIRQMQVMLNSPAWLVPIASNATLSAGETPAPAPSMALPCPLGPPCGLLVHCSRCRHFNRWGDGEGN